MDYKIGGASLNNGSPAPRMETLENRVEQLEQTVVDLPIKGDGVTQSVFILFAGSFDGTGTVTGAAVNGNRIPIL